MKEMNKTHLFSIDLNSVIRQMNRDIYNDQHPNNGHILVSNIHLKYFTSNLAVYIDNLLDKINSFHSIEELKVLETLIF